MAQLQRYSLIKTKFPREMVLLQGRGCVWGKCTFCDYYGDISKNPFETNRKALDRVTGKYGVLDVINSGSFSELDAETKQYIGRIIKEKNIHTLWVECHWIYRNSLDKIRDLYPGVNVKFRTGVETFDPGMRKKWEKGIGMNVTPPMIKKYFDGICLLICVKGQTKEMILKDIETADELFEYFNVNVFNANSTDTVRDEELLKWFVSDVYPGLSKNKKCEILISNKDLGVG